MPEWFSVPLVFFGLWCAIGGGALVAWLHRVSIILACKAMRHYRDQALTAEERRVEAEYRAAELERQAEMRGFLAHHQAIAEFRSEHPDGIPVERPDVLPVLPPRVRRIGPEGER